MGGVVADTSVWIDFFSGRRPPAFLEALQRGDVVMTPIVATELVSGAHHSRERLLITFMFDDLDLHETPLEHWIAVGDLRRHLRSNGVTVSVPDAHVAQCAIERDATLLARDAIFVSIAACVPLRVDVP